MKDNDTDKEAKSGNGSQPPSDPPKKPVPKKTPEETNRDTRNMVAASQFAYTLVIGTCLFGFVGHWLGNKLGGAPWNAILMLLFGAMAFVGEMYRMWLMFGPKSEKKDKKDDSSKKSGPPDGKNVGPESKKDESDCGCSDDKDDSKKG